MLMTTQIAMPIVTGDAAPAHRGADIVFFDEARTDAAYVVGPVNGGWRVAMPAASRSHRQNSHERQHRPP